MKPIVNYTKQVTNTSYSYSSKIFIMFASMSMHSRVSTVTSPKQDSLLARKPLILSNTTRVLNQPPTYLI